MDNCQKPWKSGILKQSSRNLLCFGTSKIAIGFIALAKIYHAFKKHRHVRLYR